MLPARTISVGGASNLQIQLRRDYFTVQSLSRQGSNWSFTRPLTNTSAMAFSAHVGDITLRLRDSARQEWNTFSTLELGAKAIPIPAAETGRVLAAQDITELLGAADSARGATFPLKAMRIYERSADGAALVMRLNLTSRVSYEVEIGGLGFALPESDGHPPANLQSIVWADPHVGGDGGFVEFVRVVDDEATLLVVPSDGTVTPLEAWRPMLEDLGGGDSYEWTVASKAWAQEWSKTVQWPFLNMSDSLKKIYPPFADESQTPWPCSDGKYGVPILRSAPWNKPTSVILRPQQTRTFALRFQLAAEGPRSRNAALEAMRRPIIHSVPGYVIGTDQNNATLFIHPPPGVKILDIFALPAGDDSTGSILLHRMSSNDDSAKRRDGEVFKLSCSGRGRVTVNLHFSNEERMTVHYNIVPPFHEQVSQFGRFLANIAWLPRDYPDPFGRSASVMPWDRSLSTHVLDDARAYDVGLSDDAGGAGPLSLASKVRAAPTQDEVSRVDEYIQYTLYGVKFDSAKPPFRSLQITEDQARADASLPVDGVRMTMYYYSEELSNTTSGHFLHNYSEADKCHKPFGSPTWCMTENMSNATYRGFNYPHQIASYWAMYTVARNTLLVTSQPWQWYLYRAARTSTASSVGAASVGFMDGTVLREVLTSLEGESAANATAGFGNWTFSHLAAKLKANMRQRQELWASEPYPYGSEFGFDTTGQEEIVVWNLFFGNDSIARRTVDHILSYMRSSPTWAYHGGGRSTGDVGNNGKYLLAFDTGVQDRGLMHYRSGLNMIPLIEWYRKHPDDYFVLEVAMGAVSGQMSNIDFDTGAPSMMFHALAHAMAFDPHSGDFGLGFFGNALESGSYIVHHPRLGRVCYLCDLSEIKESSHVELIPRDGFGINVFVEPLALYMQAECGTIKSVILPELGSEVGAASAPMSLRVVFHATKICARLRLRITKTSASRPGSDFSVLGVGVVRVRGGFEIPPVEFGGGSHLDVQVLLDREKKS